MITITTEIEEKIPAWDSNPNTPDEEVDIIIRFYCPQAGWEWFVTGGEKIKDDWHFFGYIKKEIKDWGFFWLSDLHDLQSKTGFIIERDPYFTNKKIKDIL